MTGKNSAAIGIFLTAVYAVFCGLPPACAAKNVYKTMADDIARYSNTNKVKSIAVLAFSRRARTSREESEYVSERLLTCLVESGKVKLLERSQLDKVLQEQRLGLAGLTQAPDNKKDGAMSSADAIVIGVVFGTAEHLKIIAKMIDPGTGAVLHVIEAQTERLWDMVAEKEGFEFDVPDIAVLAAMFQDEAAVPGFNDFRNAPTGVQAGDCGARRTALLERQTAALEAKAKYWALRMRAPDFSTGVITRNPGGEIGEPKLRRKFYQLLNTMFKSAEDPKLSPAEEKEVNGVMEEERKVSNECGLH